MVWAGVVLLLGLVLCSSVAQQQCNFDSNEGKLLACGGGNICQRLRKVAEQYRTLIISSHIRNFHNSFYDVHAYRLCGDEDPSDITLQDAINNGQLCQGKTKSGIFRTLTFQGCSEYFQDGSNRDLTIYAYSDVNGCNGDLLYRFLLINGTGKSITDYRSGRSKSACILRAVSLQ